MAGKEASGLGPAAAVVGGWVRGPSSAWSPPGRKQGLRPTDNDAGEVGPYGNAGLPFRRPQPANLRAPPGNPA